MNQNDDLKFKVLMAARDNGINSMLFRNAMAKKFGLSLTESLCLTLLGINKVSTPTEISKYTGLTSGATTSMLDRLEKQDVVKRVPNPSDRRGVIIKTSETYNQKAIQLVQGIQKAHKQLIESYSDEDLEVVADFLNKFSDNLVQHTNQIEKVK